MPMAAEEIETMIVAAIPDAMVEIRDLAGDGDHYAARVVSASFAGMSRVRQHQLVYKALQGVWGANFTHCSLRPQCHRETICERHQGAHRRAGAE